MQLHKGENRQQCLEAAGYDYDTVQDRVNAILTGNEPEQPATNKLYRVQVGAIANRENAEKMLQRLRDAGFEGYIREG